MADRYWVGNGGSWTTSGTTHWAASSGGAAGETAPGVNDDVYIDTNSFSSSGQTVTYNGNLIRVKSLTLINGANTFTFAIAAGCLLAVHGSITLCTDMVFSNSGILCIHGNALGSSTLLTNGHSMGAVRVGYPLNPTYLTAYDVALGDEFTGTSLTVEIGNFTTNDFPITVTTFGTYNGNLHEEFYLGASVITCTDLSISNSIVGGLVVDSGTSTINMDGALEFIATGNTYTVEFYEVNITNADPNFYFYGKMSFAVLSITLCTNIYFFNGTDITVPDLTMDGTAEIPLVVDTTGGGHWHIHQLLPEGVVNINYVDLHNSQASTGTFKAYITNGCTDGGGNVGWDFVEPPNYRYWVGNSGQWNDTAHWAEASGGPGGFSVPSSNSHTYFDGNSFDVSSAVVQGSTINILSLDMTGSHHFHFTPTQWTINGGSVILNSTVRIGSVTITLGADGACQVAPAGHKFYKLELGPTKPNAPFSILGSSLICDVFYGMLYTNDLPMSVGSLTLIGTCGLGSSTITITSGLNIDWFDSLTPNIDFASCTILLSPASTVTLSAGPDYPNFGYMEGTGWTIDKAEGTVDVSYVQITNSTAQGGATFTSYTY